jgi:hypothetical protein
VSLLIIRSVFLCLEPSIASSCYSAHLHGLSNLVFKLVFIIVVIVNWFLHLTPSTDNILLVVIVHLIVNFFTVVVEGIIHILLFDFIIIFVDALKSKSGINLT